MKNLKSFLNEVRGEVILTEDKKQAQQIFSKLAKQRLKVDKEAGILINIVDTTLLNRGFNIVDLESTLNEWDNIVDNILNQLKELK